MSATTFATELTLYGPEPIPARRAPSLAEAQQYCRRLSRSHYENFTVASILLPANLRPHFYAIYAYCRWADDLADETSGGDESLRLLDWWEQELTACYRGQAWHPVFVALQDTVERFSIPIEPFEHLLIAFRQDQYRKRYETFNDLLAYCRNSANPVGRLVLYLGRAATTENFSLSDSICTGLQLANFCQDVARDYDRGRIYLPLTDCQNAGYDEAMFERRQYNLAFRSLLHEQVDRAEQMLRAASHLLAKCRSACALTWHCSWEGGWRSSMRFGERTITCGIGGRWWVSWRSCGCWRVQCGTFVALERDKRGRSCTSLCPLPAVRARLAVELPLLLLSVAASQAAGHVALYAFLRCADDIGDLTASGSADNGRSPPISQFEDRHVRLEALGRRSTGRLPERTTIRYLPCLPTR